MLVRIVYPSRRLRDLTPAYFTGALKEIQQRLRSLGYYSGDTHGIFDSATEQALTSFQREQGLTANGTLGLRTYLRLCAGESRNVAPVARPVSKAMPHLTILITKSTRQLTLYNSRTPLRQYPVAIGKPATPTPEGNFAIATKIMNPGGVLGSRWMGLNYDSYGIHGTNAPWFIGQMVSNGCIRMHNPHVEDIFALVRVGTPVYIRN